MILGRGMEMAPRTDIPLVIAMLMDQQNLTEFEFPILAGLRIEGRIEMDYNIDNMTYVIRRTKE